MGLDDKIRHQAEEAKGKAEQGVGRATDDERLEAEGKKDEAVGALKQQGDRLKDELS